MTNNHAMQTFESIDVRTVWDEDAEKWWFSALDIVAILTEQPDYAKTRNYWKWLKNKLITEGSEVVSVTNQLKLTARDGKKYLTDVIYKRWAGKTAKEYKQLKRINKNQGVEDDE